MLALWLISTAHRCTLALEVGLSSYLCQHPRLFPQLPGPEMSNGTALLYAGMDPSPAEFLSKKCLTIDAPVRWEGLLTKPVHSVDELFAD